MVRRSMLVSCRLSGGASKLCTMTDLSVAWGVEIQKKLGKVVVESIKDPEANKLHGFKVIFYTL